MVESQPSKLLVAGSIPVSRSKLKEKEQKQRMFEQAAIAVRTRRGMRSFTR